MARIPAPVRGRVSREVTAARLAMLVVALGGLFAMHGMSDHGTAHHAVSGAEHAANRHSSPVAEGALTDEPKAAEVAEKSSSGSSSTGGLAAVCMAILVAAAGWGLQRRRAGSVNPVLGTRSETTSRARGRDRDPPSLVQLAIHRC